MYIKVASANDASNLSNLMKDGDWIVLYYANWCGHCNTMKPEWQKVVDTMKHPSNANKINIADIETSHIDQLTHKPEIAGFPTIKMYNSGNEIANFEDERIADKIHKFALLNSSKSSKSRPSIISINSITHKSTHKRSHTKGKGKRKGKGKGKGKRYSKSVYTTKRKRHTSKTHKTKKSRSNKKTQMTMRMPINMNMNMPMAMPMEMRM